LVQVSGRKVVFQLFGAIRNGYLVILQFPRLISFVEPVSLIGQTFRKRHKAYFVLQIPVLRKVEDIDFIGNFVLSELSVKGNFSIAILPRLSRDQNNAVSRTRTIY